MTVPTPQFSLHRFVWFIAALTMVAMPVSNVRANGRPPQVTGFVTPSQFSVNDSQRTMLVGLTFGAAVSTDSGKTFGWVCEDALGGPTSSDAVIAAPSAGMLLLGGVHGLRKSADGGCSFATQSEFTHLQVEAIAPNPSNSNSWWVVANGASGATGSLWRTDDAGQSYQQQTALSTQGLYYYGVTTSPANSNRVLVTAGNNGNGNSCFLLSSQDNGSHWSQSLVGQTPSASVTPRVSLSPTDAARFIVAAIDASSSGTRLVLTTDGGQTFSQAALMPEEVRNIVFSPDGTKVFAAGVTHLYRSENAGQSFEQLNVPAGNACAAMDAGRLYACGDQNRDGFSLGLSHDWGDSWDKILNLDALTGPGRCPTGTPTRDICLSQWANEAALLGASASTDGGSSAAVANSHEGGCHCASHGQPMRLSDSVAVACLTGAWLAHRCRRRRPKRPSI